MHYLLLEKKSSDYVTHVTCNALLPTLDRCREDNLWIIVMFLSDSHSDGTHSLQSIHCWVTDAVTHDTTHPDLVWPEGEHIFILGVNYFFNSMKNSLCQVLIFSLICCDVAVSDNLSSRLCFSAPVVLHWTAGLWSVTSISSGLVLGSVRGQHRSRSVRLLNIKAQPRRVCTFST